MIRPNGGFQLVTPTLTEETDKGTSSEEEPGSDSRLESPSGPNILWGISSVLPSQNNLLESRKDKVAPKKASL